MADTRYEPGTDSRGRSKERPSKDQRFEMRLTAEDDALISEAAALIGVSRSELGTAAIRAYAKDVIADYRATMVSGEEFAAVLAALDAPARSHDRLRRAAQTWREQVEQR
jgi:uncharacterized protein (DUF1778 family)